MLVRILSVDILSDRGPSDQHAVIPDLADALHADGVAVSHYLPRPQFFALRRGYGVDYLEQLDGYLRAGLIDMLVCDDVGWAVDFVTKADLVVERIGHSV